MKYKDPIVIKPLNSLDENLQDLKEALLSLGLIIDNLIGKLPFTEKNKREIRNIIRGGFFSRTDKKLEDMNRLDSEITGLLDFYESNGGKLNYKSLFKQAKDYWTKEKDHRKVYVSTLSKYLDFNIEGTIIKRLNEENYQETTPEELRDLKRKLNSYLLIVTNTLTSITNVKKQYQVVGINRTVF